MVMYCNGVEDEEEYLPQEVKQATEKYSYAVFKFLNSLYILLSQETLLNPSSGQEAVCSECKRLEFLRSSKTAKEYLTGKNVADKSLLYTFEERFERAGKYEKTTMSAINDHKILIKRSEEKWTAREDLNEVESMYIIIVVG
uniref:Egg protein C3732 n=1 Tax=Schistosoma japonicum TaxID=6182 RepID=Q6PYV7_SCHJA|nr:egg protein C3732 [Schistosoma japonicum]